jgi:hypothetical protein
MNNVSLPLTNGKEISNGHDYKRSGCCIMIESLKKLYKLSLPAVVQLGNLPGDGKME